MVSTLNSHPADRGSIPLMILKFFLFFLVILLRKYSLIIQKVQNSTQKLFVQFHYFKLFMYVYITYNEKKESKVLGHLLLITIIFWTVWQARLNFEKVYFDKQEFWKIMTFMHVTWSGISMILQSHLGKSRGYVPAKCIIFTVFPHIVSAETILFWIWKYKGHST